MPRVIEGAKASRCLFARTQTPIAPMGHKAFKSIATFPVEPGGHPFKNQLGNLIEYIAYGLAFTFPCRRLLKQRNVVRIARIKLEWRICEPGPNDMPCTADIHHFSDLQVNCCLPQVLIVFGIEERLVIYCVHYIPRA